MTFVLSCLRRGAAPVVAVAGRVGPLVGLLALLACTSTPSGSAPSLLPNLITANDFEAVLGWAGPVAPSIATEQAHSGRYALRVSAATPFSFTYRLPLGQAIAARPRALRLRVWFYRTTPDGYGALVLKITRGTSDTNVQYQEMGVQHLPIGRWVQQELEVPLDPAVTTEDQLTLYLWGPNLNTPLYADDVELTAVY